MKIFSGILLGLTLALAAVPVHADDMTREQACQILAEFAQTEARNRNNGLSFDHVLTPIKLHEDPAAQPLLIGQVKLVYGHPEITPESFYTLTLNSCLK